MTSPGDYSLERRYPWPALSIAVAALVSCASGQPAIPPNTYVGERVPPGAWPTPRPVLVTAPAEIQAMHFSSLDVKLGNDWSGEFVANTSTASIEIATTEFDLSVPRPRMGYFRFRLHLLDAPPFFVRAYQMRVIARNTAGHQTMSVLPFRIRGRDAH
jgi:hypothetical protein